MKNLFTTFTKNQSGQTLTEYALILAVIAIAAVAVMTLLGDEIANVFQSIIDSLAGGEASDSV